MYYCSILTVLACFRFVSPGVSLQHDPGRLPLAIWLVRVLCQEN